MKRYRIIARILTFLHSRQRGNGLAEEADTLKVVDVEEITVIAAPKENRKLREQPTAVTLLSQQDMQNAQVNSIKNLTSASAQHVYPRLRLATYFRSLYPRRHRLAHQHAVLRTLCRQ